GGDMWSLVGSLLLVNGSNFRWMRFESFAEPVAFYGIGELFLAVGGKFVVFAWRPLFELCDGDVFPFGVDEAGVFEAAERGVDSAAGKTGDVHDVKAVLVAVGEGLQNYGGGVRKVSSGTHRPSLKRSESARKT